jgi:hypothetical protein
LLRPETALTKALAPSAAIAGDGQPCSGYATGHAFTWWRARGDAEIRISAQRITPVVKPW